MQFPYPNTPAWLALGALAIAATIAGALLARLACALFARAVKRSDAIWDDELVARLRAPLTPLAAAALAYAALPWLALGEGARSASYTALRGIALFAIFWALARGVDVAADGLSASERVRSLPASRTLFPLAARAIKVALLAMAVVALLAQLGYPVASLVAGLGVGGIALALAAQKTLENVFGAFSIGLDEPLREGDFVRVDDILGTVEAIGLRSTRLRTLDRTLVSIPNAKLAEMRIESLSARDRMRFACTVGLEYGTTSTQIRDVLAGLEHTLRAHPMIWPDVVVVRFKELAASSLDIEVMAWFETSDWGELQEIRQEILLEFMAVVERTGAAFAFPTRTVHLVGAAVEAG